MCKSNKNSRKTGLGDKKHTACISVAEMCPEYAAGRACTLRSCSRSLQTQCASLHSPGQSLQTQCASEEKLPRQEGT